MKERPAPRREKEADWLEALLRIPTVPFREERVVEWIERLADARGWRRRRDGAGNIRLDHGPGRPDWFFVAHMDHPGFVVVSQRGRSIAAQFRGSVHDEFFPGARVCFFTPQGEVRARVRSVAPDPRSPFRLCRLERLSGGAVPPDSVGMWDFPAVRRRGRTIAARGCDDTAGVAAALYAFDRAGGERHAARKVAVLLTRGEEAGFAGALWAAAHGTIPRRTSVVSIEASKTHAEAPLGGGAVIRVGDRRSVFDPGLTAQLWSAAEMVASSSDRRFRRQLMAGGTCEATVFQAFGYRAAAVCLPLGAYHNMGEKGRLAPEWIHLDDFDGLVDLLAEIVRHPPRPRHDPAERRAYERLLRSRRKYLLDGDPSRRRVAPTARRSAG